MKSTIGLAVGLVAGIAALAASGGKKETDEQAAKRIQAENEQEELKLRQQQARMEEEEQRQRWEQENAPHKAIYRAANPTCPKCNGHREHDFKSGKVICPYCDYVERLTIDHYDIDYDEIERQKQEQLAKQRAAEEQRQLEEKKKEEARAHAVAWIVMVLFLIPVFIAGVIGCAIRQYSFLLTYLFGFTILLLLTRMYWKDKQKSIFLWALFFPLPLTMILIALIQNHRGETKKIVFFISMIVLSWLAFIGMWIGFCYNDFVYLPQHGSNM